MFDCYLMRVVDTLRVRLSRKSSCNITSSISSFCSERKDSRKSASFLDKVGPYVFLPSTSVSADKPKSDIEYNDIFFFFTICGIWLFSPRH